MKKRIKRNMWKKTPFIFKTRNNMYTVEINYLPYLLFNLNKIKFQFLPHYIFNVYYEEYNEYHYNLYIYRPCFYIYFIMILSSDKLHVYQFIVCQY